MAERRNDRPRQCRLACAKTARKRYDVAGPQHRGDGSAKALHRREIG
jgi:hypothetical protein